MLSLESSLATLQAILDGASIELLLFFLAFFAHLCIFSEYGVLQRKKRGAQSSHPEKKSTRRTSEPSPSATPPLARALSSLMKEAPHVKIDLAIKGSESDAEVQELLSADVDVLLATVGAALDTNNKDILRCLLTSFTCNASGASTLKSLMDGLAGRGLVKEALECAKVFTGAWKPRCWIFLCKSLIHRKNADGLKLALSGCKFNEKHFHMLLESAKKDQSMIWLVFDVMQANGVRVRPDNRTCKSLLSSIDRGTDESYVRKVWNSLEDREDLTVDDDLMTAIREASARSNQHHMMDSFLQKLDDHGARLKVRDTHENAHSCSVAIRALGSVGNLDGVWKEWHAMKQQGGSMTPVNLGCVVEAFATNDDPETAYGIICEVMADPATKSIVNAVPYSSVIKSFSKQKRFDRAWVIYDEMVKQNIEFMVTTYNALLDVCARSSDLARAEPLLQDMIAKGIKPNLITHGTIVKVYCAEGHLDQAVAVMEEMPKVGIPPDEVIYNTILDGCARIGDFERGMGVLRRMQDAGLSPSNFTLSVAAKLATRSRKPEKAFEVVEGLRAQNGSIKLNVYVYNNLIQAASIMGDLVKAQEVFALMLKERVRPGGRTYALLLQTCISQEAASTAVTFLRLALGLPLPREQVTDASHPWQKAQDRGVIPLLAMALQCLPQLTWAAAPNRGTDPMRQDAVIDTFSFFCRATDLPRTLQLKDFWKEVHQAMPGLRPHSRLQAWLSQL